MIITEWKKHAQAVAQVWYTASDLLTLLLERIIHPDIGHFIGLQLCAVINSGPHLPRGSGTELWEHRLASAAHPSVELQL